MTIPILNIYYLLCYAWNKLDEGEVLSLQIEDDAPLADLLFRLWAKVFTGGNGGNGGGGEKLLGYQVSGKG